MFYEDQYINIVVFSFRDIIEISKRSHLLQEVYSLTSLNIVSKSRKQSISI